MSCIRLQTLEGVSSCIPAIVTVASAWRTRGLVAQTDTTIRRTRFPKNYQKNYRECVLEVDEGETDNVESRWKPVFDEEVADPRRDFNLARDRSA